MRQQALETTMHCFWRLSNLPDIPLLRGDTIRAVFQSAIRVQDSKAATSQLLEKRAETLERCTATRTLLASKANAQGAATPSLASFRHVNAG